MGAALLAACTPVGPEPVSASSPRYALVPAAGGLAVAGSGGREIGFGRDRAGALESVARIAGRPEPVPCAAAGLDAVRLPTGLELVFTATAFVGWRSETGVAGRSC